MNIREKLYRMFILGTNGQGYKKALADGLGGIIFFTKDIQSSKQFKSLVEDCKKYAKHPIFLSIDQEGGRVERTENIHGGKKYLSAKYACEKGLNYLQKQTEEIAKELKGYGINLNFAPCVDVNTNPDNPIIGERAFSDNPKDVISAGRVVINTYRENGIIPCIKHFPGHGDAKADSHLTLPEINLSLEEMEKFHIKPFRELVKIAPMVMVAHLHCTCFDEDIIPSSLSKNAISYLRNNLGFDGVAISDDMIMKGVGDFGYVQAIEMGIKAGLDMFIYRDSTPEVIDAIETVALNAEKNSLLRQHIENSYKRIKKAQYLL